MRRRSFLIGTLAASFPGWVAACARATAQDEAEKEGGARGASDPFPDALRAAGQAWPTSVNVLAQMQCQGVPATFAPGP